MAVGGRTTRSRVERQSTNQKLDRFALYREGKTDREIARIEGISPSTVCHWRTEHGLPSHKPSVGILDEQEVSFRIQCYNNGMSDVEIARAVKRDVTTIRMWRRRVGLPSRRKGYVRLTIEARTRRMMFYSLGWNDARIAREEKVHLSSVSEWRSRSGLTRNPTSGGVSFNAVLARIRQAVGRGLPADIADDAVGNLMLAVAEGALSIDAIEASARKFGNRVLDQYASKFGPRSLDEEMGADGDGFRMIDLIRDDRSSSWLEEMGATVW